MGGAFAVLKVDLVGSQESTAYMLDVNRCTPEQVDQIAEAVAKARGGTVAEVKEFLMTGKRLPIRASQVERIEGEVGISMRMVV